MKWIHSWCSSCCWSISRCCLCDRSRGYHVCCNSLLERIGIIGKTYLGQWQLGPKMKFCKQRQKLQLYQYTLPLFPKALPNTTPASKLPLANHLRLFDHSEALGEWPLPHPSSCCQDAYRLLPTPSLGSFSHGAHSTVLTQSQQADHMLPYVTSDFRRATELKSFNGWHLFLLPFLPGLQC